MARRRVGPSMSTGGSRGVGGIGSIKRSSDAVSKDKSVDHRKEADDKQKKPKKPKKGK